MEDRGPDRCFCKVVKRLDDWPVTEAVKGRQKVCKRRRSVRFPAHRSRRIAGRLFFVFGSRREDHLVCHILLLLWLRAILPGSPLRSILRLTGMRIKESK